MFKSLCFSSAVVLMLFTAPGQAEYWLSNRVAQNCASCHSPGRINKELAARRCTLSCQGCHVNPNGGGLVSQYGKWNQERWLRSFYSDSLISNQLRPAPFAKQVYSRNKASIESRASSEGKPDSTGVVAPSARPARVAMPPLMTSNAPDYNESDYNRSDGSENITATSEAQFLERIPLTDPYQKERRLSINGGGQFRYLGLHYLTDPPSTRLKKTQAWLMAVDLGVAIRPVPEHFQVVLEGRHLNAPGNAPEQVFTTENRVRSAYVLVDNLPFNSYAMYGLYRPMFGLYNPDHESLSNTLSGLNQRSVYRALGVGAAPNVPFFNVNVLTPLQSPLYDQSKGFAVNLGGRWVTNGASLVFSYWNLNSADSAGASLNKQLISMTTGAMFFDSLIWNTETMIVKRESAPGVADAGTIFTNQLKLRMWREIYTEFNFSLANADMSLKEGASNEIALGLRAFLYSGTDVELLFVRRNSESPTASTTVSAIQTQLHLFL